MRFCVYSVYIWLQSEKYASEEPKNAGGKHEKKKKSSYPTFSLTQGDLLLYSESVYFPEQYIMRCDTFKTPKVMTILLVMHGFSFPVCWYFPCALVHVCLPVF